MYPLALILGIAAWRGDWGIRRYVAPLAAIGAPSRRLPRRPAAAAGLAEWLLPDRTVHGHRARAIRVRDDPGHGVRRLPRHSHRAVRPGTVEARSWRRLTNDQRPVARAGCRDAHPSSRQPGEPNAMGLIGGAMWHGGSGDRGRLPDPRLLGGPQEPADEPVIVTGEPLPELPAQGPDPAVGMTVPTLAGSDLDGQPMEIGPAGGAQMIVVLAHWCPHCQAELPMLVDMIDAGEIPEGVSVVGLSTGINELRAELSTLRLVEREGGSSRRSSMTRTPMACTPWACRIPGVRLRRRAGTGHPAHDRRDRSRGPDPGDGVDRGNLSRPRSGQMACRRGPMRTGRSPMRGDDHRGEIDPQRNRGGTAMRSTTEVNVRDVQQRVSAARGRGSRGMPPHRWTDRAALRRMRVPAFRASAEPWRARRRVPGRRLGGRNRLRMVTRERHAGPRGRRRLIAEKERRTQQW